MLAISTTALSVLVFINMLYGVVWWESLRNRTYFIPLFFMTLFVVGFAFYIGE